MALSLLKEIHHRLDADGVPGELRYVHTKGGHEIDFLAHFRGRPAALVEAKWGDWAPSPSFHALGRFFPGAVRIQVVGTPGRDRRTAEGVALVHAPRWLGQLDLDKIDRR